MWPWCLINCPVFHFHPGCLCWTCPAYVSKVLPLVHHQFVSEFSCHIRVFELDVWSEAFLPWPYWRRPFAFHFTQGRPWKNTWSSMIAWTRLSSSWTFLRQSNRISPPYTNNILHLWCRPFWQTEMRGHVFRQLVALKRKENLKSQSTIFPNIIGLLDKMTPPLILDFSKTTPCDALRIEGVPIRDKYSKYSLKVTYSTWSVLSTHNINAVLDLYFECTYTWGLRIIFNGETDTRVYFFKVTPRTEIDFYNYLKC